ncbi:MAG: FimB/Mfa2 family fimbrial subunit [Prevotella sp.]|nr:FimB/Mfa2 family fimbrial subunit [Prevotella sp.]
MVRIKRRGKRVLAYLYYVAVVIGIWLLSACDGMIYDGEGECAVNYKVRFRYDYNMKYADAFAHEVSWVTLYLIDNQGNVVWHKTEEGDELAAEEYMMDVDVQPGQYSLLAWCGTRDKGTFTIPVTDVSSELTCTLNRLYDKDGKAYVNTDLDRLFHGYVAEEDFPDRAGTYYYTVPLVKNTNVLRVVLQHMSGEKVDSKKFSFEITDNNGKMGWDNSVMDDEQITYYAWHTMQGEADIDTGSAVNMFGAAVAELTTARLVKGHSPRLTVMNNETGEQVLSIPLIDYVLLVKGYYNKDMGDQEFLDRQDEYNMIFFLDERDRWLDMYIYINSWKVVLQNTEI